MADDVRANIDLNIDTSKALSGLKALQSQLSALHTQLSSLGPAQRSSAGAIQRQLVDNINATGKFAASMTTVKTTAESFTTALEKNKLTMGEYFRYAGGASKSFGKNFAREFATIEKVAVERVKTLQTQYIKLGRDANGAMKAIAVRPLALDMDNLQTKTAIAAQKQLLLNQLLKQGSTQMLNWGKNTQWAGRQLMVGFTIPLGIFAGQAIKAFSDMEKQIIAFKRVYGDLSTSAKDTDAMAESIKNLATEFTKYGLAVSDTMEMAAKAAAMGKTGADLLGQVQQASKLAVLGQVEQQQALQTTISLTDTFGTAAEDLGKKINFLNAVENQTAVSIEDLTIAIPKAGPVIKQLGGDVEDLAFFLTAMREGGINASEGANALKSGLAAMINPTGKAAEMLEGFGINLQKIVKTNKGDVRGTVVEFAKALDTLDPLNRAKAIEQLFGKFQFARISTLMKNVVSDSSQAATTAQLAGKSSIELAALAARELRQLSSSPLYKFQKAIQDFQTQLAPIGEAFMKFITPIIDWVNGILKAFNSLGDGTKTFIVGFTSVVAGLGPILLMTFGLVANGFANLIKGFTALKSMFNRVQTSSQILGQETSYMTQEQMKAKAVAASLDQVHGKLIQTFNVEAGSVNKLASAYERAVVASQRLIPVSTGAGGTKGKAPKKYAKGGMIYGPGTGTSDSIPAMVSNGEFIMPAKQTKKYRPFLDAMSANRLPGFNGKNGNVPGEKRTRDRSIGTVRGNLRKFGDVSRARPSSWGRLLDKQPQISWQGKDAEMRAGLAAAEAEMRRQGLSEKQIETNLKSIAKGGGVDLSHLNPKTRSVSLGKGVNVEQKLWESQTVRPDLGMVNQYINNLSMRKGFFENLDLKKLSAQTGLSQKAVKAEIAKIQSGYHPTTSNAYKVLAGIGDMDDRPSAWQGRAASAAIKADNFREGYLGDVKKGNLALPKITGRSASDLDAMAKKDADTNLRTRSAQHAMLTGESQTKDAPKKPRASKPVKSKADKDIEAAKRSTAKSEKETAKTAKQRAAEAKKQLRIETKAAVEKRRNGEALSRREKTLIKQYDSLIAERTAKSNATRAANKTATQGISQARVDSNMRLYGHPEDPTPEEVAAKREQRNAAKAERKAAGRARAEATRKANKVSLLGMNKASQDRRVKAAGKFTGGKALGVGMGVSVAGSLAGSAIGGDLGNTISTVSGVAGSVAMVAGSFQKATAVVARFVPQIALAAIAIGGLVVIADKLGEAERERAKSIKAQAKAANMSKEDTAFFGDFFGKETTNSYISSITATADEGITNPMALAASEMRKSEDFKNNYKEIIEELKTASVDSANLLINNLSLGLSKDFAQDEIAVIVKALQDEAGRTDVNLQFAVIDVNTESGRDAAQKAVEDTLAMLGAFSTDEFTVDYAFGNRLNPLATQESQAKREGIELPERENVAPWYRGGSLLGKSYSMSDAYEQFLAIREGYQQKLEEAMASGDQEGIKKYSEYIKGINKDIDQFLQDNPAFADALTAASGSISSTFDALESALDRGDIKIEEYRQRVQDLIDTVSGSEEGPLMVQTLIRQLSASNPEIAKSISGIKSVKGQLAAVLALASGANVEKVLNLINAIKSAETLGISTIPLVEELQGFIGNIPKNTEDTTSPGAPADPYGNDKETLTQKQSARQKQAQDGLEYLSILEEEINDKYDKRIDALDKVAELNQQISEAQRDQLDLADALARGDIGAAARAAQTMRSNEAARQIELQKQALESARQEETDGLKVKIDGVWYTREQLEAKDRAYRKKSARNAISNNSVRFAAGGGHILGPGTGTSDDIPAMLSNGEYVIRAKAVKALGVDTLDKMNHAEKFGVGGFARKFANGGIVNKYAEGGEIFGSREMAQVRKAADANRRRRASTNKYGDEEYRNEYFSKPNDGQIRSTLTSYRDLVTSILRFNQIADFNVAKVNVGSEYNTVPGAAAYYRNDENSLNMWSRYFYKTKGSDGSLEQVAAHESTHYLQDEGASLFGNGLAARLAQGTFDLTDFYSQNTGIKQPVDMMLLHLAPKSWNLPGPITYEQAIALRPNGSKDLSHLIGAGVDYENQWMFDGTPFLGRLSDRMTTKDSIWGSNRYSEYQADLFSGALMRLNGEKPSILEQFTGSGGINAGSRTSEGVPFAFDLDSAIDEDKHSGGLTGTELVALGYAHPEQVLNAIGFKLPKKYRGKKFRDIWKWTGKDGQETLLPGLDPIKNSKHGIGSLIQEGDIGFNHRDNPAYRYNYLDDWGNFDATNDLYRFFANGGIVNKYADGGKVVPRNALMADAAEKRSKAALPKMLKTTSLVTRTKKDTILAMIAGDGKYKTAFETGSGADFSDITQSSIGKRNRVLMEEKNFGVPTSASGESRPTYGALVTESKIGQFFNRMIGGQAGERFNQVTDPNSTQLERYGDVSLITKSRVKNRSSFFTGDTLEAYAQNSTFGSDGYRSVPITGKSTEILNSGRLGNLVNPFGQRRVGNTFYTNSKPRYLETQTLGGFGLNDISKIRVDSSDEAAREIYDALRASGNKTRVYGPSGKVKSPFLPKFMGRFGTLGALMDVFNGAQMINSGQRFELPSTLPISPSGAYAKGGLVAPRNAIMADAADNKRQSIVDTKKYKSQVFEKPREKKSWEENTLDWFGGVGEWIGTIPGMKEFGEFYMAKDNFWSGATRALFGTLQLPLNLVGGLVNNVMTGVAAVQKGDWGTALLSLTGVPAITGALQSSFSGVVDPEKMIGTQFDAATDTVIANEWFGTDTEEGKARARLIGGALNFVGDPTMYVGIGAIGKAATLAVTGAKASAATAAKVAAKTANKSLKTAPKAPMGTGVKKTSGKPALVDPNLSLYQKIKNGDLYHGSSNAKNTGLLPRKWDVDTSRARPGWFGEGNFFTTSSRDLAKTYTKSNSLGGLNPDASNLDPSQLFRISGKADKILEAKILDLYPGAASVDQQFPGLIAKIVKNTGMDSQAAQTFLQRLNIADLDATSPGIMDDILELQDPTRHLPFASFGNAGGRMDLTQLGKMKQTLLDEGISVVRHQAGHGVQSAVPKHAEVFAFLDNSLGLTAKKTARSSVIDPLKQALSYSKTIPKKLLSSNLGQQFITKVNKLGWSGVNRVTKSVDKSAASRTNLRDTYNIQRLFANRGLRWDSKYGHVGYHSELSDLLKPNGLTSKQLEYAQKLASDSRISGKPWYDNIDIDGMEANGLNKDMLNILVPDAVYDLPKFNSRIAKEKLFETARSTAGKADSLYSLLPDNMRKGLMTMLKNMTEWKPYGISPGSMKLASGGLVSKVKPSYFSDGGLARGTDTVPAMLTPGEFIMSRSAVDNFGVDNLKAINSGQALQGAASNSQTSIGDSVYNSNSYSISVNVSSNSDANGIAQAVMSQIERIDAQRMRGSRY
jgi:TP901 family phage tail tape measure protein